MDKSNDFKDKYKYNAEKVLQIIEENRTKQENLTPEGKEKE